MVMTWWATLIRASHLDLLNGPIWQRQKFTVKKKEKTEEVTPSTSEAYLLREENKLLKSQLE